MTVQTKIKAIRTQPTYHGQPLSDDIKIMPQIMCPSDAISLTEAIISEERLGNSVAYYAEFHPREGLLVYTSATNDGIDGLLFPVMSPIATSRLLELFGFTLDENDLRQLASASDAPAYLAYSKRHDLAGVGS